MCKRTGQLRRLGGVVVSVLATGPKGRRFKPDRGDGFLRAIKIRSTPSLGWEVKSEVPRRKILRHVKDPLRYFRYWQAKFSLLRPFLLLAPDVSAVRTARELWWTSQKLSPASIITMALHVHISPGGWTVLPLVAAVLRHSSHPIIINRSIVWYALQVHFNDSKYKAWAVPWLRSLVAGLSPQRPRFTPSQCMWDLWWIKWHWDRFFPVNIIPPSLSKLISSGECVIC
jgi:hypothetical protein